MQEARLFQAVELMTQFAERTGLSAERPPERYLWTDAFAVCTFFGLARATGAGGLGDKRDSNPKDLALKLIDQVHHTLGRHRADDERRGWLSGLDEQEGEAHPTRGGLRIGKKLPERGAGEPLDEELEWERDGQYFHYLTKWMHALNQAARSTGRRAFNLWGRELAVAAHRGFTREPRGGGPKRMAWKMSIDLTRPLVLSMGQLDPLDGFLTCADLEVTAATFPEDLNEPRVGELAADFAAMVDARSLPTGDPLGLGGLLTDAHRVAQLTRGEALAGDGLLEGLLTASLVGLSHYSRRGDLRLPAERRLAFRELGLAIGLAAAESLRARAQVDPGHFHGGSELSASLAELERYSSLRGEIEAFWMKPEHRETALWLEHRNINDVMLATSLAPEGFLGLPDDAGAAPSASA